ncbi:hypothetical protein U6A24_11255 [Aquimarina gracilis]|uniref:Uncharacterized protein n=1 Tax=Aquimarina gracilis TaxID=874422 RepID=A0ABU5ZW15_9FLAO|nr:hypothetical protein [Aquimarina gracilis]MEB3346043.1 hypothetical protein [Aquimarina gracilis]
MKNRITQIIILCLGIFCTISFYAQESAFDFRVYEKEKNVYEVSFEFYENLNIKFIQVDVIQGGKLLINQEASLNRKADKNFYLFHNHKETRVYLDDLKMTLEKKWDSTNPNPVYIEIRILNDEFQFLAKNRKQIR